MENSENTQSNKPHLLYMTGLSIDKKQLNYITENIQFDKDFIYWFKYIDKKTENAFGNFQSFIDNNGTTIDATGIVFLKKAFELMGETTIPNFILKPLIIKIREFLIPDKLDLIESNEILVKFIENAQNKRQSYQIGDFFSLYISHQSDSIGVMPLSKLSSEKNFNFINTYCDKDYFENRFVDSIIVKVKNNKFKSNINEFVDNIFTTHLFDIFTSKVFLDNEFSDDKNKTISVIGFNKAQQNHYKNMKDAFSERNFFGISLLSYFFAGLEQIKDGDKIIKVCLSDINENFNKETEKEKINEYICELKHNKEYLKELIEYATKPDGIEIVENDLDADISLKIYFSNGKEITNKYLQNDIFFTKIHSLDNDKYSTIKNINDEGYKYIYTDEDYKDTYIKLPIKMMLSLPRDDKGNPNHSLYIPYMVDNDNFNISILTVGGAEHNRALAHLINKHRLQYKEDRIFGFLDNYYDFQHKLDNIENCKYNQSFLMGLNQPVAGYNGILAQRVDDENGFSDSWEAKVLGYSLVDKNNKNYNIVSIYGFSALASVYATHNIVASIFDKEDINNEVFDYNEQYTKDMKRNINRRNYAGIDENEYIKKGLASLYLYDKKNSQTKIAEKFNSKHALYIFNIDKKLYKECFLYNNKNSIFDGIEHGKRTDT